MDKLKDELLARVAQAGSLPELEQARVELLGKKSQITALLKNLGKLPPQEKPAAGKAINDLRSAVETALEQKTSLLAQRELLEKLEKETFDVTLPGRMEAPGSRHPIAMVMEDLLEIFTGLGYMVEEGPEIETDERNFQLLNFPSDHPARDMQDTFWTQNGARLLRTHTSPVQVQAMGKYKPPFAVIAPGRVFRCDSDVTHSPVFHQLEGFHVDKGIHFGHLKGSLELFLHRLYGKDTGVRLRPSFFPFTEPSAEVDISCVFCGGKGCRTCKGTGWIEILGAGMIDPNVLSANGIDPEEWTGFAFGMGLERIAMLKYGIDDIRLLFENDPRFLGQFR